MPKLPIDYANTMMYKLACRDVNIKDCYGGHTTDFRKRNHSHMKACQNPGDTHHKLAVYQFIRENGDWANWDMLLIEKYPCQDALEARKQERYFIEAVGATLNRNIPSRTYKEYFVDHAEKIKTKSKDYYHNNLEHCTAVRKQYADDHKDEIKAYKLQYYNEHLDEISDKSKKYYQSVKNHRNEKMICEICGGSYTRIHVHTHEQTKKHQKALEDIQK